MANFTIRISDEERDELEAIAERWRRERGVNISPAQVIREAVKELAARELAPSKRKKASGA